MSFPTSRPWANHLTQAYAWHPSVPTHIHIPAIANNPPCSFVNDLSGYQNASPNVRWTLPQLGFHKGGFCKIIGLENFVQRGVFFCKIHQPCFASRARLKAFKLKPNPPTAFGRHNFSHDIQVILRSFYFHPHQNLPIIECNSKHKDSRNLKQLIMYVGVA